MGLGFSAVCEVPVGRGRPSGKAGWFDALRSAFESLITDPFDRGFLRFDDEDGSLVVELHALSEPLTVDWEEPESPGEPSRLVACLKTSTVGPGYHAWAVDLLNAVGERLGVAWDWSEDETEYAGDREFAVVQEAMQQQLRAMASAFLQHVATAGEGFGVNMRLGFAAVRPDRAFSITPLGPRSRSWWEAVSRGEDAAAKCREFYIWWDRERDAEYWRKIGTALMWTEVPWRPPANEDEDRACRLALDAFDRAEQIDPAASLPLAEIKELGALLDLDPDTDELEPPDPDGIGFLRGLMRRRLPGGWSVEVPGYFFEEWDESEGRLSFGFLDRTLHISTYAIDPEEGGPSSAEAIAEDFEPRFDGPSEPLRERDAGYVRRALLAEYEEEDGTRCHLLQGCVANDGQCATVTIVFQDPEARVWAIDTWRSIRHAET